MERTELSQYPDIPEDFSVVVFGGGNGWGKRIVEAFQKLTPNVHIIEKEEATPDKIIRAVEQNQVVFLAVPDPEINGILIETRNFLIKDKVLLDCASNKIGFENTLRDIANNGASVCSTHPMVMPTISPRGHNVIFMPLGNKSQLATRVAWLVFLKMLGMKPQELDFERHTDVMVIMQMVPHLIQRILIDAMGNGIKDMDMKIDEVSRFASANYLLAELGVGRVGIQRPDVSAGIITSALQTKFGKKIFGAIQSNLWQIISAGDDRKELSDLFTIGVNRIDPEGTWRKQMIDRTEASLIRLGNLRSRSCQIEASNRPGILRDILNILHDKYSIDMTALDSQVIHKEDGSSVALFDIGISDCKIDVENLASDLKKIGCFLVFSDEMK